MFDEDQLSDEALIKAARKRILRELEAQQAAGVINNVYGGSQGLTERMNGAPADDQSLRDFFVDIERRDLPERDPETGKPIGWTKKVKRYSAERGQVGK